MSSPYWGQLPAPSVSKGRRLSESESYDQSDRRHPGLSQPPYGSTRASAQNTTTTTHTTTNTAAEVTYSPPALPTTSNAPRGGPNTRSPSSPYAQHAYSPLNTEIRATHMNRVQTEDLHESANNTPPPAAPDVPKAPPIVYRNPYGSANSLYTYNAAGQPSPLRLPHKLQSRESDGMSSSETFYRDATSTERRSREVQISSREVQMSSREVQMSSTDQDHGGDIVVSPQYIERELVRVGSIRRPPNQYLPDIDTTVSTSQGQMLSPELQQKTWAADRSPLQKLELTLDVLTKEEKRARVEAAERRVRERQALITERPVQIGKSARPLPEPPVGPNARSRNISRPGDGEQSRRAVVSEQSQTVSSASTTHAALSQASSVALSQTSSNARQQYEYSEQTSKSQMVASSRHAVSAASDSAHKRSQSVRERDVAYERQFSQETTEHSSHMAQTTVSTGGLARTSSAANGRAHNRSQTRDATYERELSQEATEYSSHVAQTAVSSGAFSRTTSAANDSAHRRSQSVRERDVIYEREYSHETSEQSAHVAQTAVSAGSFSRTSSVANDSAHKRSQSLRERDVTYEREFSQETSEHSSQVVQTSVSTGGFSLVRTGSNKLKKNPPPGLLYNARKELEERSVERSDSYNRLNSTSVGKDAEARLQYQNENVNYAAARTSAGKSLGSSSSQVEDYTRTEARSRTFMEEEYYEERSVQMRGLATTTGLGRSKSMGAERQHSYSNTNHNTAVMNAQYMQHDDLNESLHRRETLPAALKSIRTDSTIQNRQSLTVGRALQGTQSGDRATKTVKFQDWESEASDDRLSEHRQRVREYLHRDGPKPGQRTYRASTYLEEWKHSEVGMLSVSLLDIGQDSTHLYGRNTIQGDTNSRRRPDMATQSPKKAYVGNDDEGPTAYNPRIYVKCGPLLRYCGMHYEPTGMIDHDGSPLEKEIWRGSIMIVTQDSASTYDRAPVLRLFAQPIELLPPPPAELSGGQSLHPEYVDPIAGIPKIGPRGETLYVRPVDHLEEAKDLSMTEPDDGLFEVTKSTSDDDTAAPEPPSSFTNRKKRMGVDGEKCGKFKDVRGVRLHAERGHTFWRFSIAVELSDEQQRIAYRINHGPATGFWVPARGESMNVMFHSCNGFSLKANPNDFSGPDPMWRDVLNTHQTRPFHVMVGGGDQLYNDVVVNKTKHFREWIDIKNPAHKIEAPFTEAMQDELETFYLERYMVWFSQGLFGLANSQIPMVNMYDDHDIIDGYGSYPDKFMKSPVFTGLGNVAFKYYLLFQHQSVPDETEATEPSWCLGDKPGPYIKQPSRSVFVSLGKRVALLAVDTRTERTMEEVVNPDTWTKLINRCYDSIEKGRTHHLLVLLGIPIAYPRLVWLETILSSKLIDPVKALTKFGMLDNFVNKFDGGVEVLDDLGDHWTAKNHKEERKLLIEDLQDLAVDKCLRVTILSGDVHLAAVGQFYSNPKLQVPKHRDYRYMPNIISSAIANMPPPDLMANVLNKRDKVHHFDKETDENMLPLFTRGVDGKPRSNKRLLNSRNWCSIREYVPGSTPPPTPPLEDDEDVPEVPPPSNRGSIFRRLSFSSKDRGPAVRPDAPKEPVDRSRPPVSGSGFMRTFTRRGSSSEQLRRPAAGTLKRTLSLGSRPRNLFRRESSTSRPNPDAGSGDESWADDSVENIFRGSKASHESQANSASVGLRGGGSDYDLGDEPRRPRHAYTQPMPVGNNPQHGYAQDPTYGGPNANRPIHRAQTDIDPRKLQKPSAGLEEVDNEGGLDVCLNVEVNPKDPAGITVPYRLIVPRLWYEDNEEMSQRDSPEPEM